MMLRTIYTKTVYEKRWYIIAWSIASAVMVFFTMLLYPTISSTIGEAFDQSGDAAQAFLGDAAAWRTLIGYTNLQIIEQYVFLTIIMGVILGAILLAGDEADGRLQTVLAQPVSRTTVYWHKLLALFKAMAITVFVIWVTIWFSLLFLDETLPLWNSALACFELYMLTMLFSVATYSLGAITGKKALSGSVVGFFAFASYLINGLSQGVDWLKTVDKFLPFHYFNDPIVIENGLKLTNTLLIGSIIAIIAVGGWLIFVRRDIRQP